MPIQSLTTSTTATLLAGLYGALLPNRVTESATGVAVPRTRSLAEWMGLSSSEPCFIESTNVSKDESHAHAACIGADLRVEPLPHSSAGPRTQFMVSSAGVPAARSEASSVVSARVSSVTDLRADKVECPESSSVTALRDSSVVGLRTSSVTRSMTGACEVSSSSSVTAARSDSVVGSRAGSVTSSTTDSSEVSRGSSVTASRNETSVGSRATSVSRSKTDKREAPRVSSVTDFRGSPVVDSRAGSVTRSKVDLWEGSKGGPVAAFRTVHLSDRGLVVRPIHELGQVPVPVPARSSGSARLPVRFTRRRLPQSRPAPGQSLEFRESLAIEGILHGPRLVRVSKQLPADHAKQSLNRTTSLLKQPINRA